AEPGDPPPMTMVLFTSQTTSWPVVLLRQRMSLLQSPLKSCVATSTTHGIGGAVTWAARVVQSDWSGPTASSLKPQALVLSDGSIWVAEKSPQRQRLPQLVN